MREADARRVEEGRAKPERKRERQYVPISTSRKICYILAGLFVMLAGTGVALAMLEIPSNSGGSKSNEVVKREPVSTSTTIASSTNAPNPNPSPATPNNRIPTPAPTLSPTETSQEETKVESPQSNNVLMALIKPYLVFGGKELEDPQSYQSKALAWVEKSESFTDMGSMVQEYALASIYFATNGVRTPTSDMILKGEIYPWVTATNWLSQSPVCTWYGITCKNGIVSGIDLSDNLLTGSFPPEAGLLAQLESLVLTNNYLRNEGDPGHNWLGKLTKLKILMVGSNYMIYDGIPPVIGSLTELVELDVSYTVYYGYLNGDIFANLQKLEVLEMGGNKYMSPMPDAITSLSNLQYLHAEYTNMTGSLDFLTEMPQLIEVWLEENNFDSIPENIGVLSNLESLSLSNCNMTGSIPESMGNLSIVKSIWLQDNQLSGPVPASMDNLILLDKLSLHGNNLSGPAATCSRSMQFLSADCSLMDCDCCTCCSNIEKC